jgi:AcrR family transcriptional regulator
MATTAHKQTRMTAEQRRQQILDVTQAIVDERGFHAVTIDGVAREAGITRPVVYGHFDDLPGLLHALIEREADRATNQLESVLPRPAPGGDPVELLVGCLEDWLEAVREAPATWRMVLMPPEGAPPELHEGIAESRAEAALHLQRLAAPELASGAGQTSPDPELTAQLLQSFSEEAARLLLGDPERYPIERLVRHARWVLSQFVQS